MKKVLVQLVPFYSTITPQKHGEVFADACERCQYRSIRQIAQLCECNQQEVSSLIKGTKRLYDYKGECSSVAVKVSQLLGETPERLFPLAMNLSSFYMMSFDNINGYYFDNTVFTHSDRQTILNIIRTLPTEQQRYIVFHHFFKNMNYQEIGRDLNITRERVRQVLMTSLRMLRHPTRRCVFEEVNKGRMK